MYVGMKLIMFDLKNERRQNRKRETARVRGETGERSGAEETRKHDLATGVVRGLFRCMFAPLHHNFVVFAYHLICHSAAL